jgi:pimeloyl-ACP methyl ester carboxylesterase
MIANPKHYGAGTIVQSAGGPARPTIVIVAGSVALTHPSRVEKIMLVDAGRYLAKPISQPIGFRLASTPGMDFGALSWIALINGTASAAQGGREDDLAYWPPRQTFAA